LVAVEKVQCNGKAYLVDRTNAVVYDFEDGVNEVLDPQPVSDSLLAEPVGTLSLSPHVTMLFVPNGS
jgi:hypothetical protein